MNILHRLTVVGFLAIFAAACGSDSSGTNNNDKDVMEDSIADGLVPGDAIVDGLAIETELSVNEVEVGTPVEVTCTLTKDGEVLKSDHIDLLVTGTTNFEKDGLEVSFTESGEFQIACIETELGLQDETPETILVTASSLAGIDTVVDTNEIEANYLVHVTCVGTDEFGNTVEFGPGLVVTPSEETTVADDTGDADFTFKSRVAGDYELACKTADGSLVDSTPETVTVFPSALDKVVTILGDETIFAGETTEVSCQAQDKWGNAIEDVELVVEVPEQLTVSNGKVGGTVAGIFDVVCTPADGATAILEGKSLKVEALEASGLKLKLSPDKPSYQMGEQVTVGYDIVDKFGNPVPGGEIEPVTVEPTEGIVETGTNKFRFEVEGLFTFSSCVVDYPDRCDSVDAWCDGTAPSIVIEYPERGATLDGTANIVVTGWVSEDISDVSTFTINGEPVTVGEDGSFAFPMSSVQGMNMIIAEATDTFGNLATTTRSYLFSTVWFPMDGVLPEQSVIPRSARVYVDDKLFYNSDSSDEGTLSYLLGNMVQNLDLGSLIPNPVTSVSQLGCDYDVYITDITFDQPQVLLRTTFGGLKLDVSIPNFVGIFQIDKTDGGILCPGDQGGWITAESFALSTTVYISVHQPTHQLMISAGETVIVTNGLELNLDSWVLDLLSGLLTGTLENLLVSELEGMITDLVDSLQSSVQQIFTEGIEIPIDALIPGMNQVTLKINLQPELAAFDAEGGSVELNLAITSQKLVDRSILGSIGRASCLATTPEAYEINTTNPEKILLAASEEVLSQAGFSFWFNRGTHLNLTNETLAEMGTDLSSYGITDLNITTAPLLPPIITSCNPSGLATIQLGDFYVEGQFNMFGTPVDIDMYLFLEIGANFFLGIDPSDGLEKIGIQVHEPSLVEVEIAYINDEWLGQEDTFTGLIKDVAVPMLVEQLAEPIYFAIPAINLSSLLGGGGGGPVDIELPNKELVLDLKTLELVMGYIFLESGILFQDAPPPETTP